MKYKFLTGAVLAIAGAANAATFYPDEASFLAALNSYYLEGFNGYTSGSPLDGSQTTRNYGPVNGFSFTASSSGGLYSSTSALGTQASDKPLRFTFTGAPVTAVGGYISSTDANGTVIDQQVIAKVSDGTSHVVQMTGFVGFISATPMSWYEVAAVVPLNSFGQADSVYVGQAVPEPGILGMLGASSMLLIRKRQKRTM